MNAKKIVKMDVQHIQMLILTNVQKNVLMVALHMQMLTNAKKNAKTVVKPNLSYIKMNFHCFGNGSFLLS